MVTRSARTSICLIGALLISATSNSDNGTGGWLGIRATAQALSMPHTSAPESKTVDRRSFLGAAFVSTCALPARQANADTEPAVYTKTTKEFAYAFRPPTDFSNTKKPLQTHLEEVNFVSDTTKGYQYGITVDPVRIESLKQFGTPEEVAARVVTAEVNRDGVFEVTLVSDPIASDDGSYVLEYLSDGKRGKKHFVTKIFVSKKKLYVLTAQAKEVDFASVKEELFGTLTTFAVST